MAIDSVLKRFSATGLLLPFRGGCLPETSGVIIAEKQSVAWIYSGIEAAILISIINPTIINSTVKRTFINSTPVRTVCEL